VEKTARKKALLCILLIDILFCILILIAFFVSNKTTSQTIIIILVLVMFSILSSLLLYYFIYNFFKIEYEQKESILLVNNNLSKDKYTKIVCIKSYSHFISPIDKNLYAILDTDNTVWICYTDTKEKDIVHPVHPISKKEFSTYYKFKKE